MATKLVPCPQCGEEGESETEETELTCPYCGCEFTVEFEEDTEDGAIGDDDSEEYEEDE